MGILPFLGVLVFAAESVVSPVPDEVLRTHAPVVITSDAAAPGDGFTSSIEPAILGAMTSVPFETPSPEAPGISEPIVTESSPSPTPTASPTRGTRKKSMTITLLGDSMIDTLGPDGGGLPSLLKKTYPDTTFTVINHGVGAENIDSGLKRMTNGYTYLGQPRDSVVSGHPDVLVVESFGYNPYPYEDGAITNHWLRLAAIRDVVRNQLPDTKIVIAATIAPNWDVFGDGAPFISFSPEGKKQKVQHIDSYIESTIAFARGEHLPLADAYHPSRGADGNGKKSYINGGDHIHYSDAGRAFFASILADTIVASRVLE